MTALKIADLQRDAREEGISIGAYQKALETAKKLLAMGLSVEQVAQGTGLPLETIQELMQN